MTKKKASSIPKAPTVAQSDDFMLTENQKVEKSEKIVYNSSSKGENIIEIAKNDPDFQKYFVGKYLKKAGECSTIEAVPKKKDEYSKIFNKSINEDEVIRLMYVESLAIKKVLSQFILK